MKKVLAAIMILFTSLIALSDDSKEGSKDKAKKNKCKIENKIKWTTASEFNNFGFNVYRSTNKDGPFEKINKEPIKGAGTTDVEHSYEFIDKNIEPETVYYYYIESISLEGKREKFSPVIASKPKSCNGQPAEKNKENDKQKDKTKDEKQQK